MKKSAVFAGSLVVVAAAYTGIAWYVGLEAEKTIRTAVEETNQRLVKSLGPEFATLGATLTIDDYQRGVFSSQARYSFVMDDGGERLELALQDHMQHGPFPWELLKQGNLAPALAYSRSQLIDTDYVKRWFDAARGAMPLTASTRVAFGGSGVTLWELAPLEWSLDDERLSFSGGRMEVRFSNQLRDSEGEGHFASLVIGNQLAGETATLKDIRLQSSSATSADDTTQLESRLDVASVVVDDVASESLTLEQVGVTLDSTQKGSLLDAAMRYDVQRLLVGDIDLGSLSMGGKLTRFDYDALSALLTEYETISEEHGVEEGEDIDLTPADEARLLAKVVPVLASSPELALEPVVWRNAKGETSLSLTVAMQPLAEGDIEAQQDSLSEALREVRFNLSLSRSMLLEVISRAAGGGQEAHEFGMLAAMMFDAYVGRLEDQGLVRRDGDLALSTIVYRDGEVDMNGHDLAVDELLMLLGDIGF